MSDSVLAYPKPKVVTHVYCKTLQLKLKGRSNTHEIHLTYYQYLLRHF